MIEYRTEIYKLSIDSILFVQMPGIPGENRPEGHWGAGGGCGGRLIAGGMGRFNHPDFVKHQYNFANKDGPSILGWYTTL